MTLRTVLAALLLSLGAARAAPVEDVSQQWAGFWNAKNLGAVMTLYAPAPLFITGTAERWDGAASIRKHFAVVLKQVDPRLMLTSVKSGSSGTLGFDSGTFDEILAPAKGGKAIHARGTYVFLFQHGKHGWKVLEQSWTEYAPPKP
jgi:ketosteroid isomerase-like protein